MDRRQRRIFGIIVALAVVAFIGFQIRSRQAEVKAAKARREAEEAQRLRELQEAQQPVQYIVPLSKIPARTIITDRMIEVKQVPKKSAPWLDEEDSNNYLKALDKAVGRIALVDLAKNEPLRKERLARKDDLRAISFLIEPGNRAVTIGMDVVNGVGGFIRQGDYVDILGTFQLPDGNTITKAILKRVKILIVDKTYIRDRKVEEEEDPLDEEEAEEEKGPEGVPGNPDQAYNALGMVTFEVTPENAEKLILASGKINLTLVLRNPGEAASVEDESRSVITGKEIFNDGNPVKPPPEPEGTVELILGTSKESRNVGVQ